MVADPEAENIARDMQERIVILIAEDNKYDRMILQEVFAELHWQIDLRFVTDGQELVEYLQRTAAFAPPAQAPRPGLVLMDLNMPRMNGDEALRAMRADPDLRILPVVILSTNDNAKTVIEAYASGANAFMMKPGGFDEFVDLIRKFGEFWLGVARLPPPPVFV
jgi:CheY-like chemotaxis protein